VQTCALPIFPADGNVVRPLARQWGGKDLDTDVGPVSATAAGAGLAEPDALGKPPRIDERPEGLQNSGGVQVHRVPAALNGQPHDARLARAHGDDEPASPCHRREVRAPGALGGWPETGRVPRSEEHTSELQSR